tara:strand:- start:8647 stop:9003 length:357 start_codon:yes stop_codon:yes gene_type:complete
MIVSISSASVVKDALLISLACFMTIFMGLACDNHDGDASHHHESHMGSSAFESSNHNMSVKMRVDEISSGTVGINLQTTISNLSSGARVFKVILNTVDSREYVHHSEPIADEVRVDVN